MTGDGFYALIREFWSLWLMLLFLGIVVWACWPGRRQRDAMRDHADIPFRDSTERPAGQR